MGHINRPLQIGGQAAGQASEPACEQEGWPRGNLSRRGVVLGLALGGLALGGCSAGGDLVAGEQGRIARITDGDTLGLDSGLKARLAEIEAPAPGYDGREDQPFAAEARGLLVAAAMGRQGRLWYGGLTRDDYGRAIAHVIARDETGGEVWLNGYLARQGAARVRTYPDNAKRAGRLLAFEMEARAARRGLWSLDHWRVRGCDDLGQAPGFAIVEGALLGVEEAGEARARLSARGISLAGLTKLGRGDAALKTGGLVRVRGRIDTRGEPAIRLTHWAQVEA